MVRVQNREMVLAVIIDGKNIVNKRKVEINKEGAMGRLIIEPQKT